MSDGGSEFSEARGLHALGDPDIETRNSPDRGPSGSSPIGGSIWGSIIARGQADRTLWNSRGGVAAGRESLRKGGSR